MAKRKKIKRSGSGGGRSGGLRMPGGPGGGGDMGNLMSQMNKLQEEMSKTQDVLADELVTGSSGGGMVTAVCTGQQIIQSIKIEPDAVDPDDVEMLEDLVLAAVNDALQKSQELAEERMGGLTGGLNLPPGLGI